MGNEFCDQGQISLKKNKKLQTVKSASDPAIGK